MVALGRCMTWNGGSEAAAIRALVEGTSLEAALRVAAPEASPFVELNDRTAHKGTAKYVKLKAKKGDFASKDGAAVNKEAAKKAAEEKQRKGEVAKRAAEAAERNKAAETSPVPVILPTIISYRY